MTEETTTASAHSLFLGPALHASHFSPQWVWNYLHSIFLTSSTIHISDFRHDQGPAPLRPTASTTYDSLSLQGLKMYFLSSEISHHVKVRRLLPYLVSVLFPCIERRLFANENVEIGLSIIIIGTKTFSSPHLAVFISTRRTGTGRPHF